MKTSSSAQRGFTMIELIIVIVILGILAAIALPKFVDVSDDAKQSAVAGVAGAMASATSINYGGCLVTNQAPTAGKCVKVLSCADANMSTLLQGGLPGGYAVVASTAASAVTTGIAGTAMQCAVQDSSTPTPKSVEFTAMAAGA